MAEGLPPQSTVHPMRVLFMISSEPAPMLEDKEKWSLLFHDFITKCLTKHPRLHPIATEMLKHKLIEKCTWGVSKMLPKIKKARQIRAVMDTQAQNSLSATHLATSSPVAQGRSTSIIENYGDIVPSKPQQYGVSNELQEDWWCRSENASGTIVSKQPDIAQRPDIQMIQGSLPSPIGLPEPKPSNDNSSQLQGQDSNRAVRSVNISTLKTATLSHKAFSVQDKLWSIYSAGNTVPIPFLKAIHISPLALVSDNVVGNRVLGSYGDAALESVK